MKEAGSIIKSEEKEYKSRTFLSYLFTCLIGFIGALVFLYITLLCFSYQTASEAFLNIFTYAASSADLLSSFVGLTGISIILSLAFGVGIRGNLYNFGLFGQFAVGGLLSIIGGSMFMLPWYYLIFVGAAGGLIVGVVPGLLKALLRIDESVSSVLFGIICLVAAELSLLNIPGLKDKGGSYIISINPSAIIGGFNINGFILNYGVLIAIGLSIVMVLVLQIKKIRSSMNNLYKMRFIPEAKKSRCRMAIILSFIVSGALAGLAGSLFYTNVFATSEVNFLSIADIMPFLIGITASMMTFGNPIGSVFISGIISYFVTSSDSFSFYSISKYVVYIMLGFLIIYGSAQLMVKSHVIKGISFRRFNRGAKQEEKVQQKSTEDINDKPEASSNNSHIEEEKIARRLALETSIPAEEEGKVQLKNIQQRLAQVLNRKKDGNSSYSSFNIPLSPFSRVLEDYDSDSVSNMDNAVITRIGAKKGKGEK